EGDRREHAREGDQPRQGPRPLREDRADGLERRRRPRRAEAERVEERARVRELDAADVDDASVAALEQRVRAHARNERPGPEPGASNPCPWFGRRTTSTSAISMSLTPSF